MNLLMLLVLGLVIPEVHGFGLTSCTDMQPSGSVAAQTSPAPYSVNVSSSQYEDGMPIEVTLETTEMSVSFVDFFLVAKCVSCTNMSVPVGSFTNLPGSTQIIPCFGTQGAVASTSLTSKTLLTFTWTPPTGFDGIVVMTASVVQGTNTWWGNIESVSVSRKPDPLNMGVTSTTTTTSTATTNTTTTTFATTTSAATSTSIVSMPVYAFILLYFFY